VRDDDLSGRGRASTALYSRLVEQEKAGTFQAIKDLRREVIDPILAEYHGRIVKPMGDGAIAEFGSVVDAVACAVAMQRALPTGRPKSRPGGASCSGWASRRHHG
jgi:class 3 adenylate cyclase